MTEEYQCSRCAYIYEPMQGDPTSGIPPATPWKALPLSWACPHCGVDRKQFAKLSHLDRETEEGDRQ